MPQSEKLTQNLKDNFKQGVELFNTQYKTLLKRIEDKKSSNYANITVHVKQLHKELKTATDIFLAIKNPNIIDYQNLINSIQTVLQNKVYKEEFEKRRGFWYKEVAPWVRGLIGVIVGVAAMILSAVSLGVPVMILNEPHNIKKYQQTFFTTPKTTSLSDLETLEKSANELAATLGVQEIGNKDVPENPPHSP